MFNKYTYTYICTAVTPSKVHICMHVHAHVHTHENSATIIHISTQQLTPTRIQRETLIRH